MDFGFRLFGGVERPEVIVGHVVGNKDIVPGLPIDRADNHSKSSSYTLGWPPSDLSRPRMPLFVVW